MVSCTECERNFTNSRGMKVHRAKTHDVYVEDINEYGCPTCNKKLPTERGMKVHHKRKHNESLVYEEKECKHCSEVFKAHMNGKVHCSKECANKSISESLMGENNPNYGKKRPNVMQKMKEGRQEWLENMSNEEREVWKNKIGQNIQEWWDDESVDHSKRNEKVSKALKEYWKDVDFTDRNVAFGRGEYSEYLRHHVRSQLELRVCTILKENGLEYEYEPYTVDTDVGGYIPDVVTDDFVLEIKGLVKDGDKAKAKHMVDSNLNYYVYGKELPADEYFMFSELDKLVEVTT